MTTPTNADEGGGAQAKITHAMNLPASTEQDSLLTMTITEQLLEGLYELPVTVNPPAGP